MLKFGRYDLVVLLVLAGVQASALGCAASDFAFRRDVSADGAVDGALGDAAFGDGALSDARVSDVGTLDAPNDTQAVADAAPTDAAVDASAMCGAGPGTCDPRSVTSCTRPAVCAPTAFGTRCASATGLQAAADAPCESAFQCAPGLGCVADRAGVFRCLRLCCADSECGTQACTGSGRAVNGYGFATQHCLPRLTCNGFSGCGVGEGCYPDPTASGVEQGFVCQRAGGLSAGESCGRANDCMPGFTCLGLSAPRCERLCSFTGTPACAADERCQNPGYFPAGIGICSPRV